jgi:hypothetical protein
MAGSRKEHKKHIIIGARLADKDSIPAKRYYANKIEMIQRRAARYTINQYSYHSSVSAMLQHRLGTRLESIQVWAISYLVW